MQNMTLTAELASPCQEVDIISSGVESLAVAALLSSRGRDVRFKDPHMAVPDHLTIKADSVSYKAGRLRSGWSAEPGSGAPGGDLMLVCGRASNYRSALNTVAEMLYPGQTVFIVDAPLGTAFELSCLVYKLRKRMAFNVIETGPLFDEARFEGGELEISGLKEQVAICGRSVNETRTGLAIGRQLFSGLVPASNVFERGLSDAGRIGRAVRRLLYLEAKAAGKEIDSSQERSLLRDLETEIQLLGKTLNVAVATFEDNACLPFEQVEREKLELAATIGDTFVLLSGIAALAYLNVPVIETLIDRASALLSHDFRAKGRALSDLGLSGMDVREIVELVNS